MIQVRNLHLFKSNNCIMVDNYHMKKLFEIWNCPNTGIYRDSSTIGAWKIKQLKQ